MMAPPAELSLECKVQTYSMLLKSFAENSNSQQLSSDDLQTQKLEEYLSRLEEERLKIDAFKRELPLCMQLLTNAMESSRQQLQSYKASTTNQGKRPVLEEFIPIKNSDSDDSVDQQQTADNTSDKASWMTSAQLWSQANEGVTTKQLQEQVSLPLSKETENGLCPELALLDSLRQRNGGAFLPFSKERSSNTINNALPELALSSNEREMEDKKCSKSENGLASEDSGKVSNATTATTITTSMNTATAQTHRKQRRCWSPELHRRFVNALQMLGGSQVATPKQIRELMKVDGLTNDEVKSHLQKYRLHTRRPGPGPQAAIAPGPQLVVLGGIWVPPEYATAAATAHHHAGPPHTVYSAHPTTQMAPHYIPTPVPQEFYPTAPPPARPQLHQQLHTYKAPSKGRQSSPESDDRRGAGDRSESIEDGKSDSGSWKGDSGGENSWERERKKLASMREGDEESNGSEITLKF